MSDRIVCVCGCHVVTGWCMWHSDGTHPWEKADVGRLCHRCKMPVQAINIDQLIRERDRLQAENERLRKIERRAIAWAKYPCEETECDLLDLVEDSKEQES